MVFLIILVNWNRTNRTNAVDFITILRRLLRDPELFKSHCRYSSFELQIFKNCDILARVWVVSLVSGSCRVVSLVSGSCRLVSARVGSCRVVSGRVAGSCLVLVMIGRWDKSNTVICASTRHHLDRQKNDDNFAIVHSQGHDALTLLVLEQIFAG